ncbi:MAG: DUF6067 family protein, partial [Verrucomicrobiae bacterium]|nr:DUF6067 family protein [Verrucomicrobiae bacterium]
MAKTFGVIVLSVAVVWAGTFSPAAAEEQQPLDDAYRGLVLNIHSFWRSHITLRPPLFGTSADAKPNPKWAPLHRVLGQRVPSLPPEQPATPFPPADWMKPEFDDSEWWRQPGPFPGQTCWQLIRGWDRSGSVQPPVIASICCRGKFIVDEPPSVKKLTLTSEYRGGLVVYLNGKEVLRRHLGEGAIGPEALAEDYPAEAHGTTAKGGTTADVQLRMRKVEGAELPAAALRKGANVLAIEIRRTALRPGGSLWNTCALANIQLVAEGSGIVPNITRPKGVVQVWVPNLLEEVTAADYGEPNAPLGEVRIVGTLGGEFAGQIAVGSDADIRGLRAECSDLVGEGGNRIPAKFVRTFYPMLDWCSEYANPRYPPEVAVGGAKYYYFLGGKPNEGGAVAGTCLPDPPTVVPVFLPKKTATTGYPWVRGAVQTIWLVVSIPPDAKPGAYRGVVKVSAEGLLGVSVPVKVKVCGWRVPPPRQWRTFIDFVQSPDHLARHYKVPLWSDRNWAMIEKTFSIIGRCGNKTVYVPAIVPTHLGNKETMIRWVKEGEGKFRYDFGILSRYLDLYEKHCGKPRVVCLYVWDVYLAGDVHRVTGGMKPHAEKYREKTVGVTLLDPVSGKTEKQEISGYGPEAEPYWMPFGKAVMEFVEKRGLKDSLMLGVAADIRPTKEQIEFWNKVFPG